VPSRLTLLALPALLATAACGGVTASASAGGAETRPVTHAAGTTAVPVEPERIVTTTDQNALLPLLELGVDPVGSAGIVTEDGSPKFRRTEGFDTTGIEFAGAFDDLDLEQIAALQPDLVVGYEFDEDVYDELSAIAPTVLVQIFDRPLPEALVEFGDLVGERDEALRLQGEYEDRVAALREALGPRLDTLSVSVLSPGDPGTFGRGDAGQAVGTVMDDLGLPRPPAQVADDGEASYSLEQLSARSADVVLVLDFTGDRQEPGLRALVDSPTFARLPAVRAGQAHVVDGTTTVGAAWARMGGFLDVLEQHLLPARDDVVVES